MTFSPSSLAYRELLAGLAMQAYMTVEYNSFFNEESCRSGVPVKTLRAKAAVESADALIAELDRVPNTTT